MRFRRLLKRFNGVVKNSQELRNTTPKNESNKLNQNQYNNRAIPYKKPTAILSAFFASF